MNIKTFYLVIVSTDLSEKIDSVMKNKLNWAYFDDSTIKKCNPELKCCKYEKKRDYSTIQN